MRGFVLIGLALAGFLGIGLFLERSPIFATARSAMQSNRVPTGLLNTGGFGEALKELQLIRAVPNDFETFPRSEDGQPVLGDNVFQRKRFVGERLYEAVPGAGENMPSSLILTRGQTDPGHPVISVVVDRELLTGEEKGIVTNFSERGREWERAAAADLTEARIDQHPRRRTPQRLVHAELVPSGSGRETPVGLKTAGNATCLGERNDDTRQEFH